VNILFLDQYSRLGGAQLVLLDTIAAAQARGWHAWAMLPGDGPLAHQLRGQGVAIAEIPCGPYRSSAKSVRDLLRFPADVAAQARAIRNLAVQTHFDLIYINGPRLLPAVALGLPTSLPALFHAHSHVEQKLARRLTSWCIARGNASVVACSQSVLDEVTAATSPHDRAVIPNGVPDAGYRERRFPIDGEWKIGIIGRISPEKGQVIFVEAARLLRSHFPRMKFLICGAPLFGDVSYLRRVQQLALRLPVEFLGWREDIAAVLSDLDLLVVPSTQEGMGRVVIEAFSAGVPVVASPVGGIPEVVENAKTGFLFAPRDPQSLADCIANAIAQPERLRTIAANARRVWEREYRLELYQERITASMARVAGIPAELETEAPLSHR